MGTIAGHDSGARPLERDVTQSNQAQGLVTDPRMLPEDVRAKLLKARDAAYKGDNAECFHQLYAIANPQFGCIDPWAGVEDRACKFAHCPQHGAAIPIEQLWENGYAACVCGPNNTLVAIEVVTSRGGDVEIDLTVERARKVRDWLNRALPAETPGDSDAK